MSVPSVKNLSFPLDPYCSITALSNESSKYVRVNDRLIPSLRIGTPGYKKFIPWSGFAINSPFDRGGPWMIGNEFGNDPVLGT